MSDLLTVMQTGIPQFIFNKPSLKFVDNFISFCSSVNISFMNFPSSVN
jgi:ABC-type proline/glycine betaine transport system ATPase subunit